LASPSEQPDPAQDLLNQQTAYVHQVMSEVAYEQQEMSVNDVHLPPALMFTVNDTLAQLGDVTDMNMVHALGPILRDLMVMSFYLGLRLGQEGITLLDCNC
jgi:hypothetical protein